MAKRFFPILQVLVICAFALRTYAADAPTAETKSPHTFTSNIAFVSDYRFRGVSQTAKRPAVQGGFDYAHASGVYAGTWASNVSHYSYNNANMEWDFYGGYNFKINDDFGLTAGGLLYYYNGGKVPGTSDKYDTFEVNIGGNWKWVSAKWWVATTDFFGLKQPDSSKGSNYFEVNANFALSELKTGNPFLDKVAIVGHVGEQKVRHYKDLDYKDWKIGATYDLNGFIIGLAYVDTDAKKDIYKIIEAGGAERKIANSTIVLSVSKTF